MPSLVTAPLEPMAGNIAAKATYGTAGVTTFMSLIGSNHFAVAIGAIAAIATALIGWYYKAKHDRRLEAQEARKQALYELDVEERKARIKNYERGETVPMPLNENALSDFGAFNEE